MSFLLLIYRVGFPERLKASMRNIQTGVRLSSQMKYLLVFGNRKIKDELPNSSLILAVLFVFLYIFSAFLRDSNH